MGTLIVGQSSAFSLRSLDLQRARAARLAIASMAVHLEIQVARPLAHRVLVFVKSGRNAALPELCGLVQNTTDPLISIRCIEPSLLPLREQFRAAQEATVIVSEHGTLSYGALFAQEGAVLICIGREALLKEPQVMLFMVHVRTFYLPVERASFELAGMLRFAFRSATASFNLPGEP